jgi:hypothetical protein
LYLTNAEISELRNGLYQVYSVVSEIVDSGAMNEQDFDGKLVDSLESFNETLEVVHTSDMDLFASSC